MFQGLLKDVVDGTEGGVASVVMDLDGIALESYAKDDAEVDIMSIGIELSVILRSVRQAASALDAGDAHELAIVADKLWTVARLVTDNYFVVLSMAPGGNMGKGRYLLRTRAPELASELA